MTLRHGFSLSVLVLFLIPTLFLANITIGVDRTVLNQDFVTTTLDEQDVYGSVVELANTELENQTQDIPINPTDILTQDFIQNEIERNIANFYDYLYTRTDTLNLTIDISPLHDDIETALTTQLRGDLLEQIFPDLARMRTSQANFTAVRDTFRQQQYNTIQQNTDQELTDQELQQLFNEQKDTIRNQINITEQTDVPDGLEEPLQKLTSLKTEALLNDSMTYTGFTTALNNTLTETAPAFTTVILEQSDGIPQQINLTERINSESLQTIDKVRSYVSPIRIGIYIIPLLGLLLIGLIWRTAHSREGALTTIGLPLLLVGIGSAFLLSSIQNIIKETVATSVGQNAPTTAQETIRGIIESIFQVFTTQSHLMTVLGVLCILATVGLLLHQRISSSGTDGDNRKSQKKDQKAS